MYWHFLRVCSLQRVVKRMLAALVLCYVTHASAASVVVIDQPHMSLNLSEQLFLLEDPNSTLDMNAAQAAMIAGQFQPVTDSHIQLGYSHSTYWIHFRVHNGLLEHTANNQEDRFYLTVDYPLLDHVEFFHLRNGETQSMVTGDNYFFSQRYFSLNAYVFPLALQPGETGDVYIRIFSSSSLLIPIKLQTEQAFIDERFTMDTLDGIYVGITIGLGIYNLFLWLGIRSRVYGLYVLMVFSIMLFNTSITGLTFRFWPESLYFQQITVYFFSFTSGALVILFGMEYLKTKDSLPGFHRLLQLLIALCLIFLVLLFFVPTTVSAKLTAGLAVVSSVMLIVSAVYRLMQGYRPALYYCLGQGVVIISVLFTAMTSQNIIPLYHIAPLVMKWCSALELILFSIGLAHLVNNERRLREQAQQESAIAQKTLLDSQIELNKDLDEKVTLRTQELEHANLLLREMNTHDELTGLRNRRYLNEALINQYRCAYRHKTTLSMLMIDIDYFKQLNDTYGHQFGDHCLVKAAQLLTENIRRPSDIAARYGGEEFVVVLPNTPLEGALLVAEKIRQAFENIEIHHNTHTTKMTISVGVACTVPTSRNQHESLLRIADNLLYQAKSNGRNRVESTLQVASVGHHSGPAAKAPFVRH